MNGRGGKREGAGRPRTLIDEKRVLILSAQGVAQREIAERFNVSQMLISRTLKRHIDSLIAGNAK